MKFIPGKYYKTKCGFKAKYLGEFYDARTQEQEVLFEIIDKEDSCIRGYYKDGIIGFNCASLNIVSEWEETLNERRARLHEKEIIWPCGCRYDKEISKFNNCCLFPMCKKEKPPKDWVCWICKLPLYGLAAGNHQACINSIGIKQKPKKIERCKSDVSWTQVYNKMNELIDAINELRDK